MTDFLDVYAAKLPRTTLRYAIERFSKEMKRAKQMGEMDEELFTAAERDNLHLLINQPLVYYKLKALPMNNGPSTFNNNFKQVKAELDQIKRSKSYRVGKAIMYIPVRLKNLAKRVYRKINKIRKGYQK